MKKYLLLLSAILLSISSMTFAASLQSLGKSQVTKTLQGNTITTIPLASLNNQLINNSFTGYFDKSGQITGQFASKPDNDPQNDQGKWIVKSDGTLCATWEHWNQGKPICVYVYQLTNGFLFINHQSKNIETLILKDNIKSGNQLS